MFVKLWRIEQILIDNSNLNTLQIQQNPQNGQNPNQNQNGEDNGNQNQNNNNVNNNNFQTLTDPENNSNIRIKPEFEYELNGAHISTVNICRFSPNGKYLATGSDDNTIIIWVQKLRPTTFGSTEEKISWCNHKILRGHSGDVYDLSWNPESKYLISGSVDNYCMIWNIEKAKCVNRFMDHEHFVQGVSWDPRNKYILTQSSDKSVRFYKNTQSKLEMKFIYINQLKRFEIKNKNNSNNINNNNENSTNIKNNEKLEQNKKEENNKMIVEEEKNNMNKTNINSSNKKEKEKEINQKNVLSYHYYFADEDQCNTFVRRSSFSPDGKICLLVSGVMQNPLDKNELNFVVWGVSRKDFSKPKFYIPTLNKSSTCVRFCPLIFHKKEKNDNSCPALLELNYVMIFAIGTNDSVFIYGTDSIKPRYALTNIHYQSITDLAWNGDKMLAISSSDGYISFVSFEENELGIPFKPEEINWDDEKFKKQYELYFSVDIKKNVMSNSQNIITDVKIKKKKNIGNDNSNNNSSANKINENKIEGNNIDEYKDIKINLGPKDKINDEQNEDIKVNNDYIDRNNGDKSINNEKDENVISKDETNNQQKDTENMEVDNP
jgi:chromatin assembly factor 1 subunit B